MLKKLARINNKRQQDALIHAQKSRSRMFYKILIKKQEEKPYDMRKFQLKTLLLRHKHKATVS